MFLTYSYCKISRQIVSCKIPILVLLDKLLLSLYNFTMKIKGSGQICKPEQYNVYEMLGDIVQLLPVHNCPESFILIEGNKQLHAKFIHC